MDETLKGLEEFLTYQSQRSTARRLLPITKRSGPRLSIAGVDVLDFGSNDYLALSSQESLFRQTLQESETGDFGANASRLLSGNRHIFDQLEKSVARFRRRSSVLLFNSGYVANLGIIQALSRLDTAFVVDRSSHASIYDGLIISGAQFARFVHNDCEDLERKLKAKRVKTKNAVIITESLFSMDGDSPDLICMHDISKRYDALLYVDEAHSVGVFDPIGIEHADILVGTFGKAFAASGAYIAVSDVKIKDYLINVCRGFIFTTAMPPIIARYILNALGFIEKNGERLRRNLFENTLFVRDSLRKIGVDIRGDRYIVPIMTYDNKRTSDLSARLIEQGFFVPAIKPPTVPPGQERLRVSLTAAHTTEDLIRFCGALCHLKDT